MRLFINLLFFFATVCALPVFAQADSADKIQTMQNSLEDFKAGIESRLKAIESEVDARMVCDNKRTVPSTYAPAHPRADRNGCVAFADIASVTGSTRLSVAPVALTGPSCGDQRLVGSTKTCNDCVSAGGTAFEMGAGQYICRFAVGGTKPDRFNPAFNCPLDLGEKCEAYDKAYHDYLNRGACPSGFKNYEKWSAARARFCQKGSSCVGSCMAKEKEFSNADIPSCSFKYSNSAVGGCTETYTCAAEVTDMGCH